MTSVPATPERRMVREIATVAAMLGVAFLFFQIAGRL